MAQIAGFLAVFAVLVFNLVPTIYVADSPLFTTACYYLSTAHPPGYPLFAALGKLFTLIPAGSMGFKTNLAAAVFSALSYLMLFKLIERLTKNRAIAFSFSFMPVLTPLVFVESLKAEAYTLNAFLALLILHLGLKALEEKDWRALYAVGFLFGIGSGNHHTLALLGFAALVPIALLVREHRRPAGLLWLFLFFLAGFAINGQIILRSVALGETGFTYSLIKNPEEFLNVFFRKTYSTSSVQALGEALGKKYLSYFYGARNFVTHVVSSNYGPAMSALFAASAIALLFLREKTALKTYLFAAMLPWALILPKMTLSGRIPQADSIEIVSPYFLPFMFFIPLVISLPAQRGYSLIKTRVPKAAMAAMVFLLAPLLYLPALLGQMDAKNNYLAFDRGRDMLNIMPAKGWLLAYGDNPAFTTMYMQWVEKYREDVAVFNKVKGVDTYLFRGRTLFWKNSPLHEGWTKTEDSAATQYKFSPSKTAEMAARGRLFAAHPKALTERLKGNYGTHPALLLYMLKPKGSDVSARAHDFTLKHHYRLNYERAAAVLAEDRFSTEIKNHYGVSFFSALVLTDTPNREHLFEWAVVRLANPKTFFPYFVRVIKAGDPEGALSFLRWAQDRLPHSKMADTAHLTEYLLLKETGHEEEAAKKYAYLRASGLIIYLGGVEDAYKDMGSLLNP